MAIIVTKELFNKVEEKLGKYKSFNLKDFFKLSEEEQRNIINFRTNFHNEIVKNFLIEKNIDFVEEEKEGRGKIFVFYLKGKKVFAEHELGKIGIFYYSEDYACNPCRIKF